MNLQLTDKNGNKIYSKENSIYLYLKDKNETRKLWAVNSEKAFFVRRYNKHIFRKLDAYGFNYHLMKALCPTTKVIVKQEDWSELHTTVEIILTAWDCKQFSNEGFELQVFLPRNLFVKK